MEAILVTGQEVTYHLEVAMVVGCTLTAIDNTIAVKVFELHVAWSVVERTLFQSLLRSHAVGVIPSSIRVFPSEVALFEIAVGLKTPDVTIVFA